MKSENLKSLFLVLVVFFCIVNVSATMNRYPFETRTEVAVVNDCDGYRNIIETPDGHMWLVDGYDLKKHSTVLVVFNTFETNNVIDDAIIRLIEID